jgi:hypothetical protein
VSADDSSHFPDNWGKLQTNGRLKVEKFLRVTFSPHSIHQTPNGSLRCRRGRAMATQGQIPAKRDDEDHSAL